MDRNKLIPGKARFSDIVKHLAPDQQPQAAEEAWKERTWKGKDGKPLFEVDKRDHYMLGFKDGQQNCNCKKSKPQGFEGWMYDFTNYDPGYWDADFTAKDMQKAWNASAERHRELVEEITDELQKMMSWCNAYPIEVFPEPDFKKAAGGRDNRRTSENDELV